MDKRNGNRCLNQVAEDYKRIITPGSSDTCSCRHRARWIGCGRRSRRGSTEPCNTGADHRRVRPPCSSGTCSACLHTDHLLRARLQSKVNNTPWLQNDNLLGLGKFQALLLCCVSILVFQFFRRAAVLPRNEKVGWVTQQVSILDTGIPDERTYDTSWSVWREACPH